MQNDTPDIPAEQFMTAGERARLNERTTTLSLDTRIQRIYAMALENENDLKTLKALLARLEKAVPRRSLF